MAANARLSVKDWGSRKVLVTRIDYSVEALSNEASASKYKAHYPLWIADTSFTLTFAFVSANERQNFCDWMSSFMRKASSHQIASGVMYVSVPSRKYARWGVPTGTLKYGDSTAQAGRVYSVAVTFLGATKPLAHGESSQFRESKKDTKTTATFYPGGYQQGGKLDSTLFDVAKGMAEAMARLSQDMTGGIEGTTAGGSPIAGVSDLVDKIYGRK